jgi:AcrR family transcriptional regulator
MKMPKEILKPICRQKGRAARTREKIMSSAHRIFARDGFEAAKLDEIATAAGYTRGAFYANFKNKEELFVAVAGERIANHFSIAVESIRSKTGVKPKIHELLQNMVNTPEARTWVILMIEFSLFVLRHPEQKTHHLLLHEPCIKGAEIVFKELYKEADHNPPLPLAVIGVGFYALTQGLILQEMLNSKLVTPKVTASLLKTYLNAVIEDESKKEG